MFRDFQISELRTLYLLSLRVTTVSNDRSNGAIVVTDLGLQTRSVFIRVQIRII